MESIDPPSWEDLPAGALEIVFSKIDSEHLGPLRLVNSSWRNAINGGLKSHTIGRRHFGLYIEPLGRTFTRLEKLTIWSKDEDILHKLSSVKSLTRLKLEWVSCTRDFRSNGVELLTNLSALKIHTLRKDIQPNFMDMVCKLPNLKYLCIGLRSFGRDESMKQLSIEQLPGMTDLTRLDLYNSSSTGVNFLSGLTNLEALLLFRWSGGNVNVSPLTSLVNLTRLDLRGYGIGRSEVENVVANLGSLTRLDLTNNVLKNGDLATLTRLSKLTHLDLSENEVNDEGVRFLTGLVSLKRLFLNETRAKTAIQILAPLTGLEVLYLDGTPTKGTDFMGLSNLVGLKEVSVRRCQIELERVSAALPHIKFRTYIS